MKSFELLKERESGEFSPCTNVETIPNNNGELVEIHASFPSRKGLTSQGHDRDSSISECFAEIEKMIGDRPVINNSIFLFASEQDLLEEIEKIISSSGVEKTGDNGYRTGISITRVDVVGNYKFQSVLNGFRVKSIATFNNELVSLFTGSL